MDDSVTFTIAKAEALVLFDLLADFRDQANLPIRDTAQRAALWFLESRLEKTLVEPFALDYDQALPNARHGCATLKWNRRRYVGQDGILRSDGIRPLRFPCALAAKRRKADYQSAASFHLALHRPLALSTRSLLRQDSAGPLFYVAHPRGGL